MKFSGLSIILLTLAIFGWTAHAALIGITRVSPLWAKGESAPSALADKCYQAEVTDISGTKYFPAVKEALSKAEKSINLVMFVIEYHGGNSPSLR